MIGETFGLAAQAIARNALRSFLTTLGIVIGVAAVIALVTLGQGSSDEVTGELEKLGTDILMVRPGVSGMGPSGPGSRGLSAEPFTIADADAIESDLVSIAAAAPYGTQPVTAILGSETISTQVAGTDNRYFDVVDWPVVLGRGFTNAEETVGQSVCILGETVRKDLFGGADPVGQKIRLGSLSCEVIGVLEEKGAGSFGMDQDSVVLIPMRTMQKRILGNRDVSMIYAGLAEGFTTAQGLADIEDLMRDRRRITEDEEDDFYAMDMAQIASMLSGITGVLTGLLSAVAAVSLLVGGIGIMNIMLVSVTERTREIGIRLAVGATAGQVMMQFLVEAVMLSLLGGVVGIGLGLVIAAVTAFNMAIPFAPNASVVIGAFLFSALVGVVFGYFPARRAARLDPIEALRHQ
ncbi:ABC transporter permease [Sinisalibacter lacisalsi]|uniref:Multidrug ABC transporter substrate-binding protein n=1 Tax=Sinisalibacter lacisalsi TaxID=1526570 RepID=A0ABQ1QMP5_9RHOB|nr:ABC transporter permease [Sinisalibacter lacisalsi]GGD37075.1 multidrug ABC transporter substrate-binding protein [Sinisalibacter lacisalsi]